MADCGAGAAAERANGQDATRGHIDARARRAFFSYSRSVLPRAARTRLHPGTEPGHRAARRGLETGSAPRTRGRTDWAEGRHHCRMEHADGAGRQQATNSIPIIAAVMADPVGDELVASLARPGGNVTGTTFLGPELIAKRLQLLRDVVPGLTRVAALWHPHAYGERTMANVVKDIEDAARTLGMQLQLVPADGPDDIASAFSMMPKEHAGAFIVMPSPMLFGEHRRIVELAAINRLPGMYQAREFVDVGGLMSYGANLDDLFRRTAPYVDKILKGAKPADLPVERPTKFELVINLKAARAVGLTINRDILLVADEVIE
jgi:putative ABC transport system substrate-binding protein